jgi:hypothetical protein
VSFKVYMWDWIAVYTSDSDGNAGTVECLETYSDKYQGTVRDNQHRIEPAGESWPSSLLLYVPALQGEFSDEADAEKHQGRLRSVMGNANETQVAIVVAGSDADKYLATYGKRKLQT